MVKKFLNKILKPRTKTPTKAPILTREMLVKKVDRGTDRAIKEYGQVFIKLAEYDRS
jgi:hypothetical protein